MIGQLCKAFLCLHRSVAMQRAAAKLIAPVSTEKVTGTLVIGGHCCASCDTPSAACGKLHNHRLWNFDAFWHVYRQPLTCHWLSSRLRKLMTSAAVPRFACDGLGKSCSPYRSLVLITRKIPFFQLFGQGSW